MKEDSIFRKYYKEEKFRDKKNSSINEAIDVIIPIINTNELFKKNVTSVYREIPVNRLIIGNGGSDDDSLEILKDFPRVKIIDQTKNKTLGYCLTELISLVETDWFIYLHSDVYIPEKWYNEMKKNKDKYDWFESDYRVTTLINVNPEIRDAKRAYSGGQMGKKEAFKKIIPKIDDDYLYRNEDIIFKELIEKEGFKWGRVLETQFYHQVMNKKGEKEPEFERVDISLLHDTQWEIETFLKQVKGIIKYTSPKSHLIYMVNQPLRALKWYKAINLYEFTKWVQKTNRSWLEYLDISEKEKEKEPTPTPIQKVYIGIKKILKPLIKKLDSLINPKK